MSDRRRAPRYVLHTPLRGHAMPMQDAVVERFAGDQLVVIASSAPRLHEELTVHLAMADGITSRTAEMMSSRPVSVAGTMSYRLELRVAPAEPPAERGSA